MIKNKSRKSWFGSDFLSGEHLALFTGLGLFGLALWFTLDSNAFKMVSTNLGSFQNNLANAAKIIGTLLAIGWSIKGMVSKFIDSRTEIKKKELERGE